ncbi:hemicentin-2-like isoform X2 [Dreissena polymorpha]|uniref:hemicentin-2-like isoform X2 n=1 Tax=Dreissena polymorpha TaxID=45954 RepID=UPI0022648071|nr:hemicentin-2-like isoform X2 [Dreissena polymorpha]
MWLRLHSFLWILSFAAALVTLFMDKAIVRVGDPLVMRCHLSESGNSVHLLTSETGIYIERVTMSINITECNFLLQSPTMDCDCHNDLEYVCTILSVAANDAVGSWKCEVEIKGVTYSSNHIQIVLAQLVNWVTITPNITILSVIEGSYVQFNCQTSPGVPAPTVRWFKAENKSGIPPMEFTDGSQISIHPNISGTSSLLQIIPSRNDSGIVIYCKAMNTFTEVESRRRVGMNVLYGHKVQKMNDQKVQEGSRFQFDCPITPGNPSNTSVIWKRDNSSAQWTSKTLTLMSVNVSDADVYTCIASNVLLPTIGGSQSRIDSGSFRLEVIPTVHCETENKEHTSD